MISDFLRWWRAGRPADHEACVAVQEALRADRDRVTQRALDLERFLGIERERLRSSELARDRALDALAEERARKVPTPTDPAPGRKGKRRR